MASIPCTVLVLLVLLVPARMVRGSDSSLAPLRVPGSCAELEVALLQRPEPLGRVELADCYVQLGKLASAWSQYREAASAARDAAQLELATLARSRAKALEPELSYLTITTWKGQSVAVTHDGTPIDDAVLGTAIPLDPGSHFIAASAPGKRGWSKRVELGSHADHITVAVPVLPDEAELPGSPSLALPAPAAAIAAPESQPAESLSWQRTLGLVVGAVGIAGVATGTLFGVKAASDWSDAKARCKAYPYCGPEGARLARDAKTSAWVSTLSFATGIAGLSGGALLWFTSPNEEQKAPAVGVGVGRVLLRGPL